MSQLKIKNGSSWESIPAGGIGVPSGGTTGQVLKKSSNTDYATEWGKAFSVTEILPKTAITQNVQNLTLSEAAENFDAFEIRLYVNVTTGTGGCTHISRQALEENGALVFYFGTSAYWVSNSFWLFGGTSCQTGIIQRGDQSLSHYMQVFGIKY